jgi:hypothetical protein
MMDKIDNPDSIYHCYLHGALTEDEIFYKHENKSPHCECGLMCYVWADDAVKLQRRIAELEVCNEQLREAIEAVINWGLAEGDGSLAQSTERREIWKRVMESRAALEPTQ